MRFFRFVTLSVLLLAGWTSSAIGQQSDASGININALIRKNPGADSIFENAVLALEKSFVDKEFREQKLPGLVDRYRKYASDATSVKQQRQLVHDLLSNIPASHMGVLSKSAFRHMFSDLTNRSLQTFGFELLELDGKHFAKGVLEGGPAAKAGLLRGDRVMLIDGLEPKRSERLAWRTDDSYLVDPPVRGLKCKEGDQIKLLVERSWGETLEIEIPAQLYSAFEAAKASVKIIEHQGKKIGYLHLWMIHISGIPQLLKESLEGEFAECDAVVIDLRGRGGSAGVLPSMYNILSGKSADWDKPVVGVVNRYSRSAKEVIAYEFKKQNIGLIVGERTAGAVIPASFVDLGDETVMMYPTFRFGKYTDIIEGNGVAPDVYVKEPGPYSAGADPLVERALQEAVRMTEEEQGS